MKTELPNVVGPEYLVPLLHRTIKTIRVDATRRPETLPPRLHIPGSAKLLWVEADVIEWINSLRKPRVQEVKPKVSIFRGRKVAY